MTQDFQLFILICPPLISLNRARENEIAHQIADKLQKQIASVFGVKDIPIVVAAEGDYVPQEREEIDTDYAAVLMVEKMHCVVACAIDNKDASDSVPNFAAAAFDVWYKIQQGEFVVPPIKPAKLKDELFQQLEEAARKMRIAQAGEFPGDEPGPAH
jgi:hypothetical protein